MLGNCEKCRNFVDVKTDCGHYICLDCITELNSSQCPVCFCSPIQCNFIDLDDEFDDDFDDDFDEENDDCDEYYDNWYYNPVSVDLDMIWKDSKRTYRKVITNISSRDNIESVKIHISLDLGDVTTDFDRFEIESCLFNNSDVRSVSFNQNKIEMLNLIGVIFREVMLNKEMIKNQKKILRRQKRFFRELKRYQNIETRTQSKLNKQRSNVKRTVIYRV